MRLPFVASALLYLFLFNPAAPGQAPSKDTEILATLTQLEKDSWEATKQRNGEFFRTYMAPEFIGFFADGTSANRAAFISNLDDFQLSSYTMGKVSLLRINDDAVMILYRLGYEGMHKGKKLKLSGIESSSLYTRREGKWLEIFYQETLVPKP